MFKLADIRPTVLNLNCRLKSSSINQSISLFSQLCKTT